MVESGSVSTASGHKDLFLHAISFFKHSCLHDYKVMS